MTLSLICHPDFPAEAISAVEVEISFDESRALVLNYSVFGEISELEVVEQTGTPLSEWHRKSPEGPILETPYLHLALTPDRDWLYDRCNRRLDWMIDEGGAIEEVRDILKRDLDPALPAMKALGVPEIAEYLAGNMTKDAMLERIKMMTRRYAKRQMTWVRNKMNAAITSSAQDLESFECEFFPFIRRFLLTQGK